MAARAGRPEQRAVAAARPEPMHHRDPFDRRIAAQALAEDLSVIRVDPALDPYGVRRIW